MAEEIEIKNVGGKKGVASEATLIRLQETMSSMARQMGVTNNQNSKVQDAYIKSLKETSKSLEANTREIDENTEAVESNTSALGSIAGALGGALMSGITSVAGSMFGLGKELLVGGNQLSDFTQHIPLIGGALTNVVGIFEGMNDSFRSLSSQGAAFNNSLIEMQKSAIASGLSLSRYENLILENTDRMRFFGGTITQGAQNFGRLSLEFRSSNVGMQLQAMGFTVEELNESLINYAQIEARLTGQRSRDNTVLQEGTAAYVNELDRLAKLTGQSREQLAAQVAQQAVEANLAAQTANMTEDQRIRFNATIAQVTSLLGEDMGNAFKDLTDGIPSTPLGEVLYSQFAPFARLAENAENVDLNEVGEVIRAIGPDMLAFRNSLGGEGVTALGDADAGFQAFFNSLYRISDYIAMSPEDLEAMEQEREQRELLATTLGSFGTAVENIRSTILMKFFEEGGVGTRIQNFLESITTEDINSFNTNLNNFLDSFTADPGQAIDDLYNNIVDYLFGEVRRGANRDGTIVEERVGGVLVPMIESITESIQNGFTELFNDPELRASLSEGFRQVLSVLNESSFIMDMAIPDSATQSPNERRTEELERLIRGTQETMAMMQYYVPDVDVTAQQQQLDAYYQELNSLRETRLIGTRRATGRLTEPKNTIAKIHAGERVLNPQEAAEYNAQEVSSTSNAQTAMSISQDEITNGLHRLNNTMSQVAMMMSENNRLTKRTASAIAETGNLQG